MAQERLRELVGRLRASGDETGDVRISREDADRLLSFIEKAQAVAEKANALLVNAYSTPGDEKGIHFLSEDAVRLQWALRDVGVGDDSGEPCFTV